MTIKAGAIVPPNSEEAEQGLLGSMMIGGPATVEEVRGMVGPDAFYGPANLKIFVALCSLEGQGLAVDFITVTDALRKEGILQEVGGAAYLTHLFTFVPTAGNLLSYVKIVREKHMLRQVIATCTKAVRRAYAESEDPNKVLEEIQSDIIELGQLSSTTEALVHISKVIPEVLASIEATYRNRGKPIGLPSGFKDFDRTSGGFQPGRTYYFGARPAMGKSSLGTEFCEHVAIDNAERRAPVAVFSVEMTTHELAEVMLCRRSEVDLVKLRDGFFSDVGRATILEQSEVMKQAAIYIDDKADLSIFEFRARARRAVTKFGVKLIIIDYIQRMKSTSKRAQANREQEISEIAQGISATAKELKVPIIVLAQLSRKSEDRQDKVPELADFRESGSLEQEAHLVGLLHRPVYYCKSAEKKEMMAKKYEQSLEDFEQYTMLIIAKQRRGPVGVIPLRFIKKYAAFEPDDPTRPLYSNRPEERQAKQLDPHKPAAPPTIATDAPPPEPLDREDYRRAFEKADDELNERT